MIISIALVLFSYHYLLKGTNKEILVSDLSPARVHNAGIRMHDALHANSFICPRVEGKGIEHVSVVNIFEGSPLLPLYALALCLSFCVVELGDGRLQGLQGGV